MSTLTRPHPSLRVYRCKESRDIPIIWNILRPTRPATGFDRISKHAALPNLQRLLRGMFGREVGTADAHGVRNFTLRRSVLELPPSNFFVCTPGEPGAFMTYPERLKRQARAFRVYYIDELVDPRDIPSHYRDKQRGRTWQRMFTKHFYVAISPIDIMYDGRGRLTPRDEGRKPIHVVTGVGFDVSAHRLSGVHFGDFLRLLKRVPGMEGGLPISSRELWEDAYNHWQSMSSVGGPRAKYKLDVDTMRRDYKLQFALTFTALHRQGVEVPVMAAIGCGVFGRAFYPLPQEAVIRAYLEVLSNNTYGFRAVVFALGSPDNMKVFDRVLQEFQKRNALPVPCVLCLGDMLTVAQRLSGTYPTSIHNAGDLWEFGQFFEGGGSLEEYITRMTTAYLSNHCQLNPLVLDQDRYVPVTIDELNVFAKPENVQQLKAFIGGIQRMPRMEHNDEM